jgi:signal recognition particle subunit SEC65
MSEKEDTSRWVTIYPNYLDATKSARMGRRIAKADAVERPTAEDLGEALRELGVRHVVEFDKLYPRDAESHWWTPGRAKAELLNDLDIPSNPEAETKMQLIRLVARAIPQLDGRAIRVRREEERAEKREGAKREAREELEKAQREREKKKEGGGKKKGRKKK